MMNESYPETWDSILQSFSGAARHHTQSAILRLLLNSKLLVADFGTTQSGNKQLITPFSVS